MDERTANKIQIYSHDSEIWKPALLADIDADQLPVCYGGTMTDPDGNPNCITKVILYFGLILLPFLFKVYSLPVQYGRNCAAINLFKQPNQFR